MMGTKPSSATCATFWGSVTPSNRRTAAHIAFLYLLKRGRDPSARLKLTNMPSVKGYKGWHNFRELLRGEVRRISLLGNSVNKALLVCLLTLRGRLGAQPQRDVGRLHRLPYHGYQFVVQRLQVRLLP